MTNDDDRLRGIFRRAFDDLRADAATQPSAATRTRRSFWHGPVGAASGAVAAAAIVALLAVALPGQKNAAVKPPIPASEGATVLPSESEEGENSGTPSTIATTSDEPTTPPDASPRPPPRPTRSTEPQPTPTPSRSRRPACHSDWAARPTPPGVTVTLTASKTEGRPGDLVTFTVTVRNDNPVAVDYQHGNPQSSVKVDGRRGDEWKSSDGKVYTQELRNDRLAPGESRSETHVWTVHSTGCTDDGSSEPTPSGTYNVSAAWHTSQGGWISNSITFTVR